ncbi:uncharacterized protein EI90DRAFT_3091978 [Cantharellus anzutake]|uniref:uncharacterized protein n=1 Tax=Cantharellus anzutake TaxID=1750568 RepID=UPI00190840FD|nr:uncharacterized protein EI90DRAFT_3091978 [Cantharellus anzutake]KAF8313334.1 hypothetical protein EI90DRAFT_3091978 [Cantharellus anzutake]
MRFWSAFAPLALLPIVAADFYVAQMNCSQQNTGNVTPITERAGILFTLGQIEDCLVFGGALDDGLQYNSTAMMTSKVCGYYVTVDVANNAWSSPSFGKTGRCQPYDHLIGECIPWTNKLCIFGMKMVCGGGPVC